MPRLIALTALLALLAVPGRARALDLELKLRLEPGVALPLSEPQTRYFSTGGGGVVRGALGLGRYVDIGLAAGSFAFAASTLPSAVTVTPLGGGPRFALPIGGFTPWIDGDAFYVRTGDRDRFAYSAGAGLTFALARLPSTRFGLYARYLQIVQPTLRGLNDTDAKIFIAGLSVELGLGLGARRGPPASVAGAGPAVTTLEPDPGSSLVPISPVPPAPQRAPYPPRSAAGGPPYPTAPPLLPPTTSAAPGVDRDGDGVPDTIDRCPQVRGPADNFGCPWPDSDGDGIPDKDDFCPHERGPAVNNGCPIALLDSDGDGVPDRDDQCPYEPGPAATHGCPDADGDGIPDAVDACPNAAGTANNRGCPHYPGLTVLADRIVLREPLYFLAPQDTEIAARSILLLHELAQALIDRPGLRLLIEAPADVSGNGRRSYELAEQRAFAVRNYLVEHGVAADRLEAVGADPDPNAAEEPRRNEPRERQEQPHEKVYQVNLLVR